MKDLTLLFIILLAVSFCVTPYYDLISGQMNPQSIAPVPIQADFTKYGANVQRAASYLVSQFNPQVGLISESPIGNEHWLKRTEYPNYSWGYNETYWIYSDNLFAAAALRTLRPDISSRVEATIQRYNEPPSNKFESVTGTPVGPDRGAQDIIVNSSLSFAVLIRIHNGTVLADPSIPYADAIIYRALSKRYLGEQDAAVRDVQWAASLWNGTCVVDYGVTQTYLNFGNAPSDIQWCSNEKLALTLFGAEVVGVQLPRFAEMESGLWHMQNSQGGIITLATGHGSGSGSSNTETTSAALLIYNANLIKQLRTEGPKTLQAHRNIFQYAPLNLLDNPLDNGTRTVNYTVTSMSTTVSTTTTVATSVLIQTFTVPTTTYQTSSLRQFNSTTNVAVTVLSSIVIAIPSLTTVTRTSTISSNTTSVNTIIVPHYQSEYLTSDVLIIVDGLIAAAFSVILIFMLVRWKRR